MKNKALRIFLLAIVIVAFTVYFVYNQAQFAKIGDLTFWEILLITIGQSMVIISNIFILMILVRFVAKRLGFTTAARITAYSSLINFFGFLQGGLGFRGIYLKANYQISFKKYFVLTLVQYCIFFGIAGLLLILGLWLSTGLQQVILFLLVALFLAVLAVFMLDRIKPAFYLRALAGLKKTRHIFQAWPLLGVATATVFQLGGSMLASAVELHAIGATISLGGLLIYTGISQFAIIIALTPGAIGIRETILLIVQQQMHLTTENIILASTIDRVIYFVTLGLFAPLAIGVKRRNTKEGSKNQ